MLSSVDRQVGLGEQSSTVALLLLPLVRPMYWLRLFWEVFVSVQSANVVHCVAASCRNGM